VHTNGMVRVDEVKSFLSFP